MKVSTDTQGLNEINLSRRNNAGETNEDARSGDVSTKGDRSLRLRGNVCKRITSGRKGGNGFRTETHISSIKSE